MPTVNLGCDALHLKELAASDAEAVRVVIRDNAGFHLRDGDPRLPERVRIVALPPHSPKLNTCEQAWDMIKEEVSNQCHRSTDKLRDALLPGLQRFWQDAQAVLRWVGRPWQHDQANASCPRQNPIESSGWYRRPPEWWIEASSRQKT
ncbi:MAG TPA: hypothetical protein DIT13_09130 [Verrucomicrobiales bacterium]|nr:hypothetical protein [Verrucomicrobiales bacterium]